MARILVTGASGFIGAALVQALASSDMEVRGAYRRASAYASCECAIVGDLGPGADWLAALREVSAIVHLAGPAHVRHGEAHLRRAIVEGAAALAEQAEAAGVSRFVFVSSIKAAASSTKGGAVSERDPPEPEDAYGRAKLDAERVLLARPGLRPLVLRPPLVFAPNAKANFARLLRLADSAAPLPFEGVNNKRSLISLPSLIEAIMTVLRAPDGPSGIFHVADEPPLSTPDIIAALRRGMGRPARLFSVPGIAALVPRALTQSLEIDASALREAYKWRGIDTVAALEACGAARKAAT